MTSWLRGLADVSRPGSVADRFRQRRFGMFRELVDSLPRPVRILDVGGTTVFWERVGYAGRDGLQIVLINLLEQDTLPANITAQVGDATDLSRFADDTFDIAVSNSVIEHLPTLELQERMAAEMLRVGRRVYAQTPNRYFPLEPHFLFPFFGILPMGVRAFLLQHMDLGWRKRQPDRTSALAEVRSVRLVTGSELRRMFPAARIVRERLLWLTKSYIVLQGWDEPAGSTGPR
jgi:SAM-dependent methyltransferase